MTTPQQPFVVSGRSGGTNGLGVAGFVLSLVGWFSCGFFSPLALILSAVALRREPRGLAIAGLILGILGSAWLFIWGLGFITALLGIGVAANFLTAGVRTDENLTQAASLVFSYQEETGKAPADDAQFAKLLENSGLDQLDAWDHSLRYSHLAEGEFEIRSAGPDGKFDTGDDLALRDSLPMPRKP